MTKKRLLWLAVPVVGKMISIGTCTWLYFYFTREEPSEAPEPSLAAVEEQLGDTAS